MKKIITLMAISTIASFAVAQSPYTISADNFPVFSVQTFDGSNTPTLPYFMPAANGNWNLSAFHSGSQESINYTPETDPYYTNAGVNVYASSFKSLTPSLGYNLFNEFDFNATGVYDKGIYIDPQGFGLGALTGNSLDSLTFPFQGAIFGPGRQVMKFPATYQSAWQSQNRRLVDFKLTVSAFGLNKTPGKHVFTIFRSDTIVGWGKMRVYANGFPSAGYNVLIDRSIQYAVDSFFLAGAPAPPTLLNAFGMTQGQKTDQQYRYTVYREGNSTPLSIMLYSNSNFTTPTDLYFDKNNLATTDSETPVVMPYATLLFPNPCTSGTLNLQILGETPPSLSSYEIFDIQGHQVAQGKVDLVSGLQRIQWSPELPNGNYLLRVLDEQKQAAVTEQFVITK